MNKFKKLLIDYKANAEPIKDLGYTNTNTYCLYNLMYYMACAESTTNQQLIIKHANKAFFYFFHFSKNNNVNIEDLHNDFKDYLNYDDEALFEDYLYIMASNLSFEIEIDNNFYINFCKKIFSGFIPDTLTFKLFSNIINYKEHE